MTALPLRIDTIATPLGGAIGMLHCPGRCGGAYGVRDVEADLKTVEAWGAAVLVSLIEHHEFERLGVPLLPQHAAARSFHWLHAPIPDFAVPGAAFKAAWIAAGPRVYDALRSGKRIALHCAAGLGRTGTLAAILLRDLGVNADDAIKRVRVARKGTIETAAQAAYVHASPRLLMP